MSSLFKTPSKVSKAAQPAKKTKKVASKRPKGLGLIKKFNEKVFSPDYDYGF